MIPYEKLNIDIIVIAIIRAVEDTNIRQNAVSLGAKNRDGNEVKIAVEIIQRAIKERI